MICFWTPLAFFLPDAARVFLIFTKPRTARHAVAHRTRPVARAARSLRYNELDDDAKRAVTAAARPSLDVQL